MRTTPALALMDRWMMPGASGLAATPVRLADGGHAGIHDMAVDHAHRLRMEATRQILFFVMSPMVGMDAMIRGEPS